MRVSIKGKTHLYLVFIAFIMVAAVRIAVAKGSGFWCDEFCWIRYSMGSMVQTIANVKNEPGPMGPLDLTLISIFAKNMLRGGFDPHIAFRFQTIFFITLSGFIIFGSSFVTRSEKWAWVLWSATNSAMNAMAINTRPYAGMIFFSSCALFAAIELIRSNRSGPSGFFWVLMALCLAGSLAHPYIIFTTALLLFLLPWSSFSKRYKVLITSVLLASIAIKFVWFVGFRTVPQQPFSLAVFFERVLQHAWRAQLNEGLHALASPGSPLKVLGLFYVVGLIFAIRERKLWAFSLVAIIGGSLIVPILLNLRYGYFFAPRQLLIALPFLGWLTVLSLSAAANRGQKVWLPVFFVFFIVGVFFPLRHWIRNVPPYVDIPRYKMHEYLNSDSFGAGKMVIVLSLCHLEAARLYSSPQIFSQFFANYAENRFRLVAEPARIVLWSQKGNSCAGEISAEPTDLTLAQNIQKFPERYVVLAPFNVTVPSLLRHLPCRTETNVACQLN